MTLKQLWAITHSITRPAVPGYNAEMRHKSHQLYVGANYKLQGSSPDHAVVARFVQKFISDNGHPDRVYLEGLRWDQAAGEWKWDNVFWEYKNGHRVRYPDYSEVIGKQEIIK